MHALEIINLKVTNINSLCDNKNVKIHCFNLCKKQPLGTSPVSTDILHQTMDTIVQNCKTDMTLSEKKFMQIVVLMQVIWQSGIKA